MRDAQQRGAREVEVVLLKELLQIDPQDKEAQKRFEQLLIQQAKEARQRGDWTQEITILTTWRQTSSSETRGRIDATLVDARNNQQYAWMYENVVQLVKEGNLDAAKILLKEVWSNAPKYGDPAQVARTLGMRIP